MGIDISDSIIILFNDSSLYQFSFVRSFCTLGDVGFLRDAFRLERCVAVQQVRRDVLHIISN